MRVAVGKEASLLWDTFAVTGPTITLPWNIRQTTSITSNTTWNTLASVSCQKSISWNVREGVGKLSQLLWNVRERAVPVDWVYFTMYVQKDFINVNYIEKDWNNGMNITKQVDLSLGR